MEVAGAVDETDEVELVVVVLDEGVVMGMVEVVVVLLVEGSGSPSHKP